MSNVRLIVFGASMTICFFNVTCIYNDDENEQEIIGPDWGSDTNGWHTFFGSDSSDSGTSIASDSDGNIFVAGYSSGSWMGPFSKSPLHAHSVGGGNDSVVLKLSSNGVYKWHTFYGGGARDEGNSIAIGSDGSVLVAGFSEEPWNGPMGQSPNNEYAGSWDAFVLSLTPNGLYKWHSFFGSVAETDIGCSVVDDGDGNIYVAGYTGDSWNGPSGETPLYPFSGNNDIFVIKLDPQGAYQWHAFFGSNTLQYGHSLAIDCAGNLFVVGESYSWDGPNGEIPLHANSGELDVSVLKLSSNGQYQWHTFLGSSANEYSRSCRLDRDGNLLVTGWTDHFWDGPNGEIPVNPMEETGDQNFFVLKLDANGQYKWHTFYGAWDQDHALSVASNALGEVYVTGDSYSPWMGPNGQASMNPHAGEYDGFLLKLSSNGTYLWHTFWGSSGIDYSRFVQVDGSENIVITGSSDGSWDAPDGQSPLNDNEYGRHVFVIKLAD